jgi:hypothetical protein
MKVHSAQYIGLEKLSPLRTITDAIARACRDLEALLNVDLREYQNPARQDDLSMKSAEKLSDPLDDPRMMLCRSVIAQCQPIEDSLGSVAKSHV